MNYQEQINQEDHDTHLVAAVIRHNNPDGRFIGPRQMDRWIRFAENFIRADPERAHEIADEFAAQDFEEKEGQQ